MPARQRGFARKRGRGWLAVWREAGQGTQPRRVRNSNGGARLRGQEGRRSSGARCGRPLRRPASDPAGCLTVSELVEAFLARHRVDEATLRTLRFRLNHAVAAFGGRRIETLQPIELDVWRSQLPPLSAHYIFRAFRQVLEYAVAMGLLAANPTARIGTRGRPPAGAAAFQLLGEVEAIAAEMDPRYAAIPIVLVGTGLRPEELFALERRDLDLDAGVLRVERVYTQRVLKEPKKSSRQRRRVPLRARVVEALRGLPPRLDTPLLFPAARGGHIDLAKFRYRSGFRRCGRQVSNIAASRLPPHVRVLGDRGRRPTLLPRPDHGDERRADRLHLRPPVARLGGVSTGRARPL